MKRRQTQNKTKKTIISNKNAVIFDALRLENLLSTYYTRHKFYTPRNFPFVSLAQFWMSLMWLLLQYMELPSLAGFAADVIHVSLSFARHNLMCF